MMIDKILDDKLAKKIFQERMNAESLKATTDIQKEKSRIRMAKIKAYANKQKQESSNL